MVEEWVMGKSERVGARTRRCKRDGQRGKGGVEEEERRMEGKMNSRWQSDNPGYDRSEYLPVRWRYTHRLHRNALIYRTSAMCRERRAPRAYVPTYIHTYICTNVYINASACCVSLRTTGRVYYS